MKSILKNTLICQLLKITIAQMLLGPGHLGYVQPGLLWAYQINENSQELNSNSEDKSFKRKDCDHDISINQFATPKTPEFIILPYPVPAVPIPVMPPALPTSLTSISQMLPNSDSVTNNAITMSETAATKTISSATKTISIATTSTVTKSSSTTSSTTTSTRIPNEIKTIERNLLRENKNLLYQDVNSNFLPSMRPLLSLRSTIAVHTLKNENPKRFKIVTANSYRRRQDYYKPMIGNSYDNLPKYGLVRLSDSLAMSLMKELKKENRNKLTNLNNNLL